MPPSMLLACAASSTQIAGKPASAGARWNQPLRQRPGFQSDPLASGEAGFVQHRQQSVRARLLPSLLERSCRVSSTMQTLVSLPARNASSPAKCSMLRFLLLMLEAVTNGPRSTISLKRSTQNRQLSTSRRFTLPHLLNILTRLCILTATHQYEVAARRSSLPPSNCVKSKVGPRRFQPKPPLDFQLVVSGLHFAVATLPEAPEVLETRT